MTVSSSSKLSQSGLFRVFVAPMVMFFYPGADNYMRTDHLALARSVRKRGVTNLRTILQTIVAGSIQSVFRVQRRRAVVDSHERGASLTEYSLISSLLCFSVLFIAGSDTTLGTRNAYQCPFEIAGKSLSSWRPFARPVAPDGGTSGIINDDHCNAATVLGLSSPRPAADDNSDEEPYYTGDDAEEVPPNFARPGFSPTDNEDDPAVVGDENPESVESETPGGAETVVSASPNSSSTGGRRNSISASQPLKTIVP